VSRFLFVCPNLFVGGAERQWSLLLPGLVARGADVSVLTLDGEGSFFDQLRAGGIDVRCATMRRRTDLAGWRRARKAASPSPDVVVTLSVSALVVGHVLARRSGAAHVSTEHSNYSLRPLRRHQRALTRLVAPRVDAAVAVARAQLPSLAEHGFDPARLHVIPTGVRADDFVPTRPRLTVRAELGLSSADFVACFVGGLKPEKRPADFVAAVAQAHVADVRIRGLIVGDGTLLAETRRLAAETGGTVRLLGVRSDVPDFIAASDAVCLTSVSEALPMSLLEAMAIGRPVVATAVGGVPELVQHGRTGLLVPPRDSGAFADALASLARDPAGAAAMGTRGRDRQRDLFSSERMVADYADLLGGVSASRGVAGHGLRPAALASSRAAPRSR
jgi:glycosyltransferase involved in cell wall biosynthesis